MKKVLVVVDMQKDFIDGVLGTEEAKAIVSNIQKKINQYLEYKKEQETVIYVTRDTHYAEDYEIEKFRYSQTQEGKKLPVPHCIKGTEGWELDKAIDFLHLRLRFGS